jgi:hypothetical protein
LQKAKADAAGTAGFFAAGGTLLSGASSLADKWAPYQYKGPLLPGSGVGSNPGPGTGGTY